jgi:methyl-accepting chemotaxis protein
MKFRETIKFKMSLLTLLVIFSMLAIGFAGYYTLQRIEERTKIADLLEQQTTNLQKVLRNITEIVLIPDSPQTVKQIHEIIKQFDATSNSIVAGTDDQQLSKEINSRIEPEWLAIKKEVTEFLKIGRPNPDDIDTMIAFGKLSAKTDKLLQLMTEVKTSANQRSKNFIFNANISMGIIAFSLIIFTAIILISLFRSISKPLEDISNRALLISQGDLTVEIPIIRNDEIGIMSESFKTMVANLRKMISQTSDLSSDVNNAAVTITEVSGHVLSSIETQNNDIENTVHSINEVDDSIIQLQENSNQLFSAATETASAAGELSASIMQVATNAGVLDTTALRAVADLEEMVNAGNSIVTNVENVARFAEETSKSMEQISSRIKNVQDSADRSVELAEQVSRSSSEMGISSINDAVGGIENIRNSVAELTDVVNRLGLKSMQISKIITVIEDIASQTSLLALNAAILAAQAGPHGKAFTVVAGEIRSLAERTFLSTKEIIDVVTSVQNEASSSVKMAHSGMETVQQGIILIDKVKYALESIYDNSLTSTEMSHAIRKEATEEVIVIGRINQSIDILRNQIEKISCAVHQQNGNTVDMNILMEEIKQNTREIAVATQEQSKTSVGISMIAEDLLNQSKNINNSIMIQKQKSNSIVDSSTSIQKSAILLGQYARNMGEAAESLHTKADTLASSINTFEV